MMHNKYHQWPKAPVVWEENGKVYASVVFTWQIDKVPENVIVGGPAAKILGINKNDMSGVLEHHNPDACFTTRGCIRNCKFCAVPKIEGDFREIRKPKIKPIVCDNNFLASSKKHFDTVIDGLKKFKGVDFNQGLDARLMTQYHANRLAELDVYVIRLAWDYTPMEPWGAIEKLKKAGFPKSKIRVYVLIGFNDSPGDALYRLETLKSRSHLPNPMRYQPIDTPKKNSYVAPNWTHKELMRFMRYWARLRYTSPIPFEEFDNRYTREKKK